MACDLRSDGLGVRVEYETDFGNIYSVGDPDGNGGVCGISVPPDGWGARYFRVCTSDGRCGNWKGA